MSAQTTMQLAPMIPLAGSLLVGLLGRFPNLREGASLLAGVVLLVLVVSLVPVVADGGRPAVTILEILPGLAFAFAVEPLGMIFALVASSLWIVTTLYAIGYMRSHDDSDQTRFFACFAIAIAAAIGVAFSSNLLTLFICYEVLTISTYPLVTHDRTPEAMRSGRIYLGVLFTTSIGFLLFAVIWTWSIAGTLDFRPGGILAGEAGPGATIALLALFAFGTGKAALMPFHRWLPAAMVAPTPVSALLHAVAVVKAGVFTVMKIIVYVFGIDFLAGSSANLWLVYAACFTIVIASLIAMRQDNLKARLAYSTISQLSYIVLGAALATASGVIGGSMHIAMHAFGKITLFFCAGAIYVAAHKRNVSDLDGIGKVMPLTMTAFLIGSFSVIGVPPMGGLWGKWFITLGALEANLWIPVAVLILSSLLNVAYLVPVAIRAFFAEPKNDWSGVSEAPALCTVPIVITATGTIVLFFYAGTIYEFLKPLAAP